ncbi:MAG: phage holin family protein [Steroidobacteraceae bacterium]|jgi:uncharacterized membrane protein YqjE
MRLLWLLPKAAPALLRHLAAYADLAGYDMARFERELAASIVAFVVVAVCLFFAVVMGCAAVLALTWDTPHRLAAIAWLGGGFLVVALIAIAYRLNLRRNHAPFMASVRGQWQEDKVILERILSDDPP